jgi:TonB family protein
MALLGSNLASRAEPPAADPDLEGILIRHVDRGRFTIYEPRRRPWLPWDFMVYPVLGVNDDGGRWMNLRVKTKGVRPLGLKSLGVVFTQASSSFALTHSQVEVDASGCWGVVESVELAGQEDVIRGISESTGVALTFEGIGPPRSYRLTSEDLAAFRQIVRLFERESLPPDPAQAGKPLDAPEIAPAVPLGRHQWPKYPKLAQREKRVGTVVLSYVIRKDGTVDEIEVVSSTGHGCGFEEAAIAAVKSWRYKPATRKREAVEIHAVLPFDFGFRR